MYRIIFAILFIGSALVSLSGCGNPGQAEQMSHANAPKPKVSVYTVKSETVPLVRELPGRTAAYNVAQVRPQVNGIVLKRQFEEGAIVNEGQELYEIDAAVYKAHFNKATAHLKSLETTKKRVEQLRPNKTVSEQEYDDAIYAWEQSRADVELARLNLEYCQVKAPLTGKIGRSLITVGALVTNGQEQELAVIQQIDPIYVDLKPAVPQILKTTNSVSETEKRSPFWHDATVTLTLEDGSKYPHPGKIAFLDNHVQEDTGTVNLRAVIPNPDGSLLPGMFVRAAIEEGVRNDGILIPQRSLFRDFKGYPYVWIIGNDNKAQRREVKTQLALGNTWLVDEGLEAGDRIVVEGVQFLAPDMETVSSEIEKLDMKTTF